MLGTKVMKLDEWKGHNVWYKVACSCCGGDNCDSFIEFSIDKDFGDVEVSFHKEIVWDEYWGNKWFFTRWFSRLKLAIKVLFTGRITLEGDFSVQGQDHIDSILEAWQEGRDLMVEWREDFEKEQKENENT